MSAQSDSIAEALKAEGNTPFLGGWQLMASTAAVTKYSQAIAFTPANAVLYSNRAAALVKMAKLDAALNDALRFTSP